MGSIHLIRILDDKARQDAIGKFLDIRETWVRFPGHVMGITREHLQALQQAHPPIPFEFVSKAPSNGQSNSALQS